MQLLPLTQNLSLVLDFGLTEEEFVERLRTRAGHLYVLRGGALHRGADPAQPAETWSLGEKRWTPYRGAPLTWTCNWSVISERAAERVMWPEFFAGA